MTDLFAQFNDYLTNQKSNSVNTRESYLRDVSFFKDFLEYRGISDPVNVDENIIEEYTDHLRYLGRSATTVSRTISSLRCFYKYLIFVGVMSKNPTKAIKLEKTQKKLPQVLTGREIDLLLAQPLLTEAKGYRDKAMLELYMPQESGFQNPS